MEGYLLLADGTRLDGELKGAEQAAVGWLVANTAVVGFQEMTTDPAYRGTVLAFTYPEVGNVGVAAAFNESPRVQAAALVVKVLSEYRSHYTAERDLEELLVEEGVPCLCGVDTRGVAVHLRDAGEMAAVVAPADAEPDELLAEVASFETSGFPATETVRLDGGGVDVAVLDLGMRRSDLAQLRTRCRPGLFSWTSTPEEVTAGGPAGVIVSDGPAAAPPPDEAVQALRAIVGRVPVLGLGLGNVALGMALGCDAAFLRRGHHGANYPVRNLQDGAVAVTHQRHTVVLDRGSVEACPDAEVLWENINDGTVEGILGADGTALGLQAVLAAPEPGALNPHLAAFLDSIAPH
jgi:carbamoyl-phosphate synthase small subunit